MMNIRKRRRDEREEKEEKGESRGVDRKCKPKSEE